MASMNSTLENSRNDVERKEVLEWISELNPERKHCDIRQPRVHGTGQWLLEDLRFKAWRQQRSNQASFLWCYGAPGSGKSWVIDELCSASAQERTATVYFYFDYKDPSSQSLDNLTRCLLKQICKLQPNLPPTLISLYRTFGKRQGFSPQSDLVQALISSSKVFNQVFFVIDALDECESSTAEEVLTMLKALPSCTAILVTSRQIGGGIKEILQAWPQIEIQAQSSDLRSYILHKIATKVRGVDLDLSSTEEIVEKITRNARHMFLLGVLHVEAVLREPTIGEMLDALEDLSESLDGAFGETMQRIRCQPQSRRRLAQKCLLWLCHARRPLKIEELRDALALMTMGRTATSLEPKYRPSEATIIDSCHGLVTVEKRSEVIRLVHYSLYEYLAHDSNGSLLGDQTPEKTIAELCINYQMLDRFCYQCIRNDREGFHVRSANDPGANELALKFLQTKWQLARSYQMWQCLQGLRYKYWEPQEAASCKGLHLAAMFGLYDLIPRLLDTCSIDEPTHLGTTALINAASFGHTDLVHLLLSIGADPGKKNWYGTALHCAAEANQVETIHALCNFHTDIDIIDDHGRTPLSCAAQSGRSNSLRALLDRGASVDLYHRDEGTALHRATLHGEMIDVIQDRLEEYTAQGLVQDVHRPFSITSSKSPDLANVSPSTNEEKAKPPSINKTDEQTRDVPKIRHQNCIPME
ncbi:MAG: hypothetical protein Q9212_005397 [Teloschistes hypoglaucus]